LEDLARLAIVVARESEGKGRFEEEAILDMVNEFEKGSKSLQEKVQRESIAKVQGSNLLRRVL